MKIDTNTIEQLVIDAVVKQLASAPTTPPTVRAEIPATLSENSRHVDIVDTVITEAGLEARVNGSLEVRIGPRSVLTPSARDFVRSRNLRVTRAAREAASASGEDWLAIVVATRQQLETSLPEGWKHELQGSTRDAITLAVGEVCRGAVPGVAVLTEQPDVAACLANRNPRIRAMAVSDACDVRRAVEQLGANVLAIDPAGKGSFLLRRMLDVFRVAGAPVVPPDFEHSKKA